MNGISCSNPKGAFYAFPKIEQNKFNSDKEFVLELLRQKGVLTVHGSGFGEQYGSGHFQNCLSTKNGNFGISHEQNRGFCSLILPF